MLDRIRNDLKQAMKSRDKIKTSILRMMLSEIIAAEKNGQTDQIETLKQYMKKLVKSAECFEGSRRATLKNEIYVVNQYLPPPPTEQQINDAIQETLQSLSTRDFGPIMKATLQKLQNADNKLVSEMLKKILATKE